MWPVSLPIILTLHGIVAKIVFGSGKKTISTHTLTIQVPINYNYSTVNPSVKCILCSVNHREYSVIIMIVSVLGPAPGEGGDNPCHRKGLQNLGAA